MKFPPSLRSLFERDHLIRAFWSLLIGLVMFLLGMYYNSTRQPSKVEVVNTFQKSDTVIVRFDEKALTPNEQVSKTLSQLARDISDLKRSYQPISPASNPKTMARIPDRPISDVVHRWDQKPVRLEQITFEPTLKIAQIQLDKFSLPPGTKGYSNIALSTLARVQVVSPTVKQDSLFSLVVELLDPRLLGKISPLFLEFLRKDSELSYTQLASQQYKLEPGRNLVRLAAHIPPGHYEVEVGFYVLDDIKGEYPRKYTSRHDFLVLK